MEYCIEDEFCIAQYQNIIVNRNESKVETLDITKFNLKTNVL